VLPKRPTFCENNVKKEEEKTLSHVKVESKRKGVTERKIRNRHCAGNLCALRPLAYPFSVITVHYSKLNYS